MKCQILPLDLKLKRDFVVAKGRESLKRNFIFVIERTGLGEASGSVHYGVTPEEIARDLKIASDRMSGLVNGDAADVLQLLDGKICSPALCAVSTAWYDWKSKQNKMPLYKFLGLAEPSTRPTSVTVSVGDIESLTEFLQSGYQYIKIKMDANDTRNQDLIKAINDSRGVFFRIDANGSWSYEDALWVLSSLDLRKVELLEQPFAPSAVDDWKCLRNIAPIPIFMDESVVSADDVKRVAEYVDGVNIKIQKSGRLDSAVEAITVARAMGIKTMLGCMIESSVGIAAAYHLSGSVDYLDLDGRLLVEEDPFSGLIYDQGCLKIPSRNGHGISFV